MKEKKKAGKILCSLLAAAVAAGTLSVSAFAADAKEMRITLRIEGIKDNLYYNTAVVPYSAENLTVQDALMYFDGQSDDITITGVENSWITAVNDETQGTFGGWDGWLYMVNGVSPNDTVSGYNLSDGDSIVLYYGDPYGAGMQYPAVDRSRISEGVLTFTSEDTVYDSDYNPTTVVNPVADMTVTWSFDGGTADYITDENGSVRIDDKYLTAGSHGVSVNKTSDEGIPLVLRLEPGYSVELTASDLPGNSSSEEPSSQPDSVEPSSQPESVEPSSQPESVEQSAPTDSKPDAVEPNSPNDGKTVATGDSEKAAVAVIFFTSALFAAALALGKKKNEE